MRWRGFNVGQRLIETQLISAHKTRGDQTKFVNHAGGVAPITVGPRASCNPMKFWPTERNNDE